MKFKERHFYMHKLSADLCVEVIKILSQTENEASLLVRYWNLGYMGRPWLQIDEDFSMKVGRPFMNDWAEIDMDLLVHKRTSSGFPGGFPND